MDWPAIAERYRGALPYEGSMTTDAQRDAEVDFLRDEVDRLTDGMMRLTEMVGVLQGHVKVPITIYETENIPPAKVFEFVIEPGRMQ